jgi:hypothetical protein
MHFVTVNHDLVPAKDAREAITFKHLLGGILSEEIRTVSVMIVRKILNHIGIIVANGVGPHQIAHCPLSRHLLKPVYLGVNFIHLLDPRTYPAVHSEVLISYKAGEGHAIKQFHKSFIRLNIILLDDLLPKRKSLSHRPRLVIPSEHVELTRIVQLPHYWLHLTLIASINSMISRPRTPRST